ncbi:hypothetical protein JCM10212_006270 [Sporobolomyces blumeae]
MPRTSPLAIRSPSLTQPYRPPASFSSSSSSSRPLTPRLPPFVVGVLQTWIVLLVLWCELGTFWKATKWDCSFDDRPSVQGVVPDRVEGGSSTKLDSRWRDAATATGRATSGLPFHVLVATDPQLLDMRSYPGRNRLLKWLGVQVTNLYAKKSWSFVTRYSKGKSNRAIDAVVWGGDLLDSGLEMVDEREHSYHSHLFHRIFRLPRQVSASSALSSSLHPPLPVIFVPGNHDLGLHLPAPLDDENVTSSNGRGTATTRSRFEQSFGPTFGSREWNGWELVWIDSMALLEEGFWNGEAERGLGPFAEMRSWLDRVGQGPVTQPRVLLSHIPLFRSEGTACGRRREASRPIRQGRGKNYQNELGQDETRWIMERVRPEVVFSGDDHDACFVTHPYVSPLDHESPVTETTVKAFSMAMGVAHPGYTLVSLYAPLPASASAPSDSIAATFTQRSCVLPSQLGIWLHLYLPLFASLVLFFVVPKSVAAAHEWTRRRRRRTLTTARGHNGSLASSSSRRSRTSRLAGHARTLSDTILGAARRGSALAGGPRTSDAGGLVDGGPDEEEDTDALFPTFAYNPFANAAADTTTYGYSANLSGSRTGVGRGADDEGDDDDNDEGPLSNLPSPTQRDYDDDDDEGGTARGKVRRVSRVFLWEKDDADRRSSSAFLLPFSTSSSSPSLSSTPRSRSPGPASFPLRLAATTVDVACTVVHEVVSRLSQHSLVVPVLKRLKPIVRLVRTVTWFVLAKPLVRVVSIGVGVGETGLGKVACETWDEVKRIVAPGVGVWAVVSLWFIV